jgi:hypothetical protein
MAAISVDELVQLARKLRHGGFAVGTTQILRAQDLLIALADQGVHVSQEKSEPYLRPLFCTNPHEQTRFHGLFLDWLNVDRREIDPPPGPHPGVQKRASRWRWVFAAAFALFAAFGTSYYLEHRKPSSAPVAPIVVPPPIGKDEEIAASGTVLGGDDERVRDATLWFLGRKAATNDQGEFTFHYPASKANYPLLVTHTDYESELEPLGNQPSRVYHVVLKQGHTVPIPPPPAIKTLAPVVDIQKAAERLRRFNTARDIATAVPLVLAFGWWLWIVMRRLRLKNWQSRSDPGALGFRVRSPETGLFGGSELSRNVQALRRRRPVDLADFSPELTVAATAERLGRFTPIYTSRRATPEYLALIDRASHRDQLARFEDDLLYKLSSNGVYVDRYFYSSDPRSCYDERTGVHNLTLEDLAARHGDHTLLLFGDGRALFAPMTLEPRRWLDSLTQWDRRVLVTPSGPAEWSYREWVLASRGFRVVAASTGAIAGANHESAEAQKQGEQGNGTGSIKGFPASIERRPDRWTDSEPPAIPDVARLGAELRAYLGTGGFDWLCACAVYPGLHWALTNHFGQSLGIQDFEGTLRKLVRLPWFRLGSMPGWLRLRLLGGMSRDLRQRVMKALDEFLSQQPSEGAPVEELELVLRKRSAGWDSPNSERRAAPTRDYVFLCFLMGRQPDGLTVPAPGRIRRWLFDQGHAWLGLTPWTTLAIGGLLSAAIWFGMGRWSPPAPHAVAPSTSPSQTGPPTGTGLPPPPAISDMALRALDVAESQVQNQAYFNASGTPSNNTFTQWCFNIAGLLLDQNPNYAIYTPPTLPGQAIDYGRGDLLLIPKAVVPSLISFVAPNANGFATVEVVAGKVKVQYHRAASGRGIVNRVAPSNLPAEATPKVPPAPNVTQPAPPLLSANAPVPLLGNGQPVDWWFVFKFNTASYPGCAGSAQRACPFGGTVQAYKSFGQQFAYASSADRTLKQGGGCLGDTALDPLGATFNQIYNGNWFYVLWNDQFYGDPINTESSPSGGSKGLLAWGPDGKGMVVQVSTPSWPASGGVKNPRKTDGNTLGCVKDNNTLVSQHFFALNLNKDDVVAVLKALMNASVVTDQANPQVVNNGGPADIQALARGLGKVSTSPAATKTMLSSGVVLVSKPSKLHVPPWQMLSAMLGGEPLRVASWWARPEIPSTTATTAVECWDPSLGKPGAIEIATTGTWAGKTIGLEGMAAPGGNHAKIGVSNGAHMYAIFGDLNQQGALMGNCASSQNGRGGIFFVLNDAQLAESVRDLIKGGTAPVGQ